MPAKLLLIEDVETLGKRTGEIITVKPGFARNFLVPQGYAVYATKKALRMRERLVAERQKKAEHDRIEALETVKVLDGQVLSIAVKVDQEGHMYGSVSIADILHLLESKHSIKLEKRAIVLKHPIKETGVFAIPLKLKEEVDCSITLKVVSETAAAAELQSASS